MKNWAFRAAAAIPCVVLLAYCLVGLHEWWLISTKQIVVIPPVARGTTSAPEVPASRLVPLILGSGILSATFAYALWRGSRRALGAAYLAVALLVAAILVRRML